MKKIFSKIILWLISLNILFSINQIANAEKYSIDRHDRYLDSEVGFFDGDGNKVYLDQYEGTNILLVFWATWCGTCVSELPALDNLQKDFRKLPFKVIALSQDYKGVDVVKDHFFAHELRHLGVFHDHKNQLFRELSVVSLPTAFFINADGKNKLFDLFRLERSTFLQVGTGTKSPIPAACDNHDPNVTSVSDRFYLVSQCVQQGKI
ncbi:MAG: TlpA family protein disulfide reductase, partial [Rickettsiaceae bacterium]|nr:TlpA family protein disulfide reductase [Rickettsiaceae bacterium]